MASIRRTLSPARHGRKYPSGVEAANSPFSLSAPSQKLNGNSKYSASAFFLLRRGGSREFGRSLYICVVFFLLGLLLGMLTFSHVDHGIQNHDFSLEMIKPPHVHVQLDEAFTLRTVSYGVNSESGVLDNGIVWRFDLAERKQLIVITPTYSRAMQGYFLNRLEQVLRLVQPPLLWIVVEMEAASFDTAEMLRKSGLMYRHLVCARNSSAEDVKDRGVHQRNAALEHIERHRLDGIVYFADEDVVYSMELFERLRGISRFGTWPVAMLAQSKNKAILEGPVCNETNVIGWHTNEKSKRLRRFHVDMSGFAFNSTILWDPKRWFCPSSAPIRQLDTLKEGFQETTFIEQIVEDESQMEGLTPGCSRILNWHLHIDARGLDYPKSWLLQKNLDVVLPIK